MLKWANPSGEMADSVGLCMGAVLNSCCCRAELRIFRYSSEAAEPPRIPRRGREGPVVPIAIVPAQHRTHRGKGLRCPDARAPPIDGVAARTWRVAAALRHCFSTVAAAVRRCLFTDSAGNMPGPCSRCCAPNINSPVAGASAVVSSDQHYSILR
jgi:hypothetical protein